MASPIHGSESMSQTTLNRSPEETAEIERHKYFLSEKAGYDVGWEAAERDWESNHAEQFRRATNPKTKVYAGRGLSSILERLLSKSDRT